MSSALIDANAIIISKGCVTCEQIERKGIDSDITNVVLHALHTVQFLLDSVISVGQSVCGSYSS